MGIQLDGVTRDSDVGPMGGSDVDDLLLLTLEF